MSLLFVLVGWCVLAALLAPIAGRMIRNDSPQPRARPQPQRAAHDDREHPQVCYIKILPIPRAPRQAMGR